MVSFGRRGLKSSPRLQSFYKTFQLTLHSIAFIIIIIMQDVYKESNMVINLNNLVNVLEASHRLGIHPDTVKRLIYRGKLPAVKVGNTWLIDKDELNLFASTYTGKRGAPKKRRLFESHQGTGEEFDK